MRLIDADKTIGHIKTRMLETALNNATAISDVAYTYQECADNRIEIWVDEMPTVDAVEVVRCGECKNFERHNDTNWGVCWQFGSEVVDDSYCSYGEKK